MLQYSLLGKGNIRCKQIQLLGQNI